MYSAVSPVPKDGFFMSATTFGERLRQLRKARRMTLEKIFEITGISHVSVGAWERGENNPRVENLVAVADALELSGKERESLFRLAGLSENSTESAEELTREPIDDPDLERINELWRDGKISERDKKVMLLLAAQNEEDERGDSIGGTGKPKRKDEE